MADLARLEAALVKADAAGNADDARAFANEIRRMRGSGGDKLELAPEPSALDNGIAGFKKAFSDIGQGLGQVAGTVSREDVARTRAQDADLMNTTSGTVGNVLGNVAAVLPAAFIPGVNGVVGGMALGGLLGAVQPSVSGAETATNAGFGAVGGGIGAKISQFLASRATARAARSAATKPAMDAKNAIISDAQKSGYAVPPQDAGAGAGSQILNAVAGKIKTEQKSSVLNQSVTNAKAARAIGLPENEPITIESIKQVRDKAGEAYEAVKGIGKVTTDARFAKDLDNISKTYRGAAKDFPDLVNDQVMNLVNSLKKPQFGADSGIDAIRILRDKADSAFRSGDKGLGKAHKKAADAIEDMIGRHLERPAKLRMGGDIYTGTDVATIGKGVTQYREKPFKFQSKNSPGISDAELITPDLVKNFQDARQLIAKTYTVTKALNQSTGNINARKVAAELAKGKPLSGELEDIAKFAQSFPKANQDIPGVNPYSVLDAAGAVGGMAVNPAITAYVAARPIVRSMVLNPTYQKMFVKGSAPSSNLTNMLRLGSKTATPLSALAAMKSQEDK